MVKLSLTGYNAPSGLSIRLFIEVFHIIKLAVIVSPKSKKPRIVRTIAGFKFFLSSPPIGGKANTELELVLSEILSLPRSKVSVISGHKSKLKCLQIDTDLTVQELERCIQRAIT